jgi:hypothetical protein
LVDAVARQASTGKIAVESQLPPGKTCGSWPSAHEGDRVENNGRLRLVDQPQRARTWEAQALQTRLARPSGYAARPVFQDLHLLSLPLSIQPLEGGRTPPWTPPLIYIYSFGRLLLIQSFFSQQPTIVFRSSLRITLFSSTTSVPSRPFILAQRYKDFDQTRQFQPNQQHIIQQS